MARTLLVIAVLVCLSAAASVGMPGGLTESREPTPEDQIIAESVRDAVSNQLGGANFDEFQVVSVRTQVVAGINYFMRVKVGVNQYINIRVFKALPVYGGGVQLLGVEI